MKIELCITHHEILDYESFESINLHLGTQMNVIKVFGPNKPALNIIICTEMYNKNWDYLEPQKGQVEIAIFGFMFATYLILLIPLYLKRKANEKVDKQSNKIQKYKIPKSLESLILNFGFVGLTTIAHGIFAIMNT